MSKIPYIWCEDHIAAAYEFLKLYPQYKRTTERSKKIRLKRNTGRKGFTWFRKGDITIGYLHKSRELIRRGGQYVSEIIDVVSAYSGHKVYEKYSMDWCIIPANAVEFLE